MLISSCCCIVHAGSFLVALWPGKGQLDLNVHGKGSDRVINTKGSNLRILELKRMDDYRQLAHRGDTCERISS